jgi:5,10-methylenetetrahydromethanopterin reductase
VSRTSAKLSCGFPPTRELPEYARQAESLGYERVWVFDSPALYGDVWVGLGRVADATRRIGLGTAVAVPSLRHVMVTASAIASIEELAPGRLVAAFGTGFTARMAMGKRPMRWTDVRDYVVALRALLQGEVVEVDGAACQLLHSPGFAPARPIDVPLLLAPIGPKGFAVAREVGDGVVLTSEPTGDLSAEGDAPWGPRWRHCAILAYGTVIDPGEDHTTARVRAAAGPWFATMYHAIWEWGRDALDAMPGGGAWHAAVDAARPGPERHLAVHEGHVVALTDRDGLILDAAGPALLESGWTGDATRVRTRLERAGELGVTEVIYTPTGPDIPRELAAFATATGAP